MIQVYMIICRLHRILFIRHRIRPRFDSIWFPVVFFFKTSPKINGLIPTLQIFYLKLQPSQIFKLGKANCFDETTFRLHDRILWFILSDFFQAKSFIIYRFDPVLLFSTFQSFNCLNLNLNLNRGLFDFNYKISFIFFITNTLVIINFISFF